MNQYAWKIERAAGAALEGTTSLEQLEAVLEQASLPAAHTAADIISITKIMQFEGQGIYRHRAPGEEWTLLWVELR
ncbi:hypothetical protein ASG25_13575 [Rhizobium sp. Leaf384]|uniref:hypothetical protein n=1 Tax=unclassified Rhizobium TaxID=2613769 RepID=UPI000713330C|nr:MULTISPECIES: hypothetical protein [unclassified Rhizobium]KQR75665.1 hypothetical protein ASG03_18430 [Rhizobium sp. Leaf341]KQS77631.1 hypothetical protein ASG25_13575 [Rhizobium sp. Leaf384]KQS83751.1 hypothetical protein ASG58_22010 [Rhizobium sp. Leaf383]